VGAAETHQPTARTSPRQASEAVTVLSAIARDASPPKPAFRMLFELRDVVFEKVLPAWWQLHSEVGIVCDLLAALRERGTVGSQFLSAASAIEAYHRRRDGKARKS